MSEIESLPIIDISAFLDRKVSNEAIQETASAISSACRDFGFFYLVGHGIPIATTDRIISLARSFFLDNSDGEKFAIVRREVHEGGDGARGYQRVGENVTIGKRDWHEAIDLYAEWDEAGGEEVHGQDGTCMGKNQWPQKPPELRQVYEEYIGSLKEVGNAVVRAMGHGLGLPDSGEESKDVFANNTKKSFWVMRLIGYPPLPRSKEDVDSSGELSEDKNVEQFSCGTHTDYGCVTLLLADQTPHALQVQTKDGRWIYADPVPGAFVVNIGDMIERWTNGIWKSTKHRVIHKGLGYRVSVPFFFEPDWEARVKPLEKCVRACDGKVWEGGADPVKYGEHLIRKIKGNFY